MDAWHRVQQGHVVGAVERQALGAVVVHHLWDAGEHTAALVQGEAVLFGLGHDDVNAALAGSESQGDKGMGQMRANPIPLSQLCCEIDKNPLHFIKS